MAADSYATPTPPVYRMARTDRQYGSSQPNGIGTARPLVGLLHPPARRGNRAQS